MRVVYKTNIYEISPTRKSLLNWKQWFVTGLGSSIPVVVQKTFLFLFSFLVLFVGLNKYGLGQITQVTGSPQTATTNTTTLTITKPSGLVVGDVMIANITQNDNDNNESGLSNVTSNGWTVIKGESLGTANQREWHGTLLYRAADGSEGNSFTFNLSSIADAGVGAIVAFSGVDGSGGYDENGNANSGPFDVAPGTINVSGNISAVTATSTTTTTNNAGIIMFGLLGNDRTFDDNSWQTAISPGKLSELYDANTNQGADNGVGAAWAIMSTAGGTGNGIVDLSGNARNGGILIALKSFIPTTSPSCTTPISPTDTVTDVAVSGILSWNPAAGAMGYYIYFGTDTSAINIENGTDLGNVTSYTPASDLDFLIDYYWKIVPYNSIGSATGCSIWSFTTEDISYCDPDVTTEYEYLTRVQINNDIDNSSGYSSGGYGYHTNLSTSLIQGETNVPVSFNINDFYIGDDISIWIDWNKDGDFTDAGEDIVCQYLTSAAGSFTFNVPATASVGNTRIRIRLKYLDDACTASSCGNTRYGEVEDYTLNISAACAVNAFSVTGGGSYCSGGIGLVVGLDDSETDVTYELYRDGIALGITTNGTGSAVSFGSQTVAGNYTVVGTHDNDNCDVTMTGSVDIKDSPLPQGSLTGSTICSGETGQLIFSSTSGTDPFTLIINSQTYSGIASGTPFNASPNPTTTTIYSLTSISDNNSCVRTSGITGSSATITVSSTGPVDVDISANPSGTVCAGTSVIYTATPTNGGTNPSYQWKVNGTNVGTDSNDYSYVPVDGDKVLCVLTSDSECATGGASVPITYFSWDDNTKGLIVSDTGLDAILIGGGQYVAGGVGGTTALGPIISPKTDIVLNLGSNSAYNSDGVDYSISYRRAEGSSQMFTRGSSIVISGGSTFNVSYRLDDGLGGFTTVTSSSFPIVDLDNFHDYRFVYDPTDGYGRLYTDGTEVWTSSATPGKALYWVGAGNLIVGANTDASGNLIPTYDNLLIKGISLKTATDEVTVAINPPTITLDNTSDEICFGDVLASIAYSATTGSPDQYSIDFDATAEGEGFVDVVNATLSGIAISIDVPAAGNPATYNALLTVRNSTTTCNSTNYNITIIIHPLPNTGEITTDN